MNRLTLEHVWPQWIGNALKHRGPFKATILERRFTTPAIDFKARAVCGPCNNGWLADLEARVKPVLKPIITCNPDSEYPGRGPTRIVKPSEAALLATWAAKTVLTHEFFRKPRVIPQGEFRQFYQKVRPVGPIFVFMGAYKGGRWATRSWRAPLYVNRADGTFSEHPVGYTALLQVGHVAFKIVRAHGVGLLTFDDELILKNLTIWPVRDNSIADLWPLNNFADSDETIDNFSTVIGTASQLGEI